MEINDSYARHIDAIIIALVLVARSLTKDHSHSADELSS